MKIVYCLNSICYLGGIQKVTIVKANTLANIEGNEVYIIVTDNDKHAVRTAPLSDKVKLIDLGINYYSDDWKSKLNILIGIFKKRLEHKRKLKKVLNDIKPDIVVSTGECEKYLILRIPGDWIKIREIHSIRNYRFLMASSLFHKILAICGDIYDYHVRIKRYDQIVLLSKQDKEKYWNNYNKISVIPNPITLKVKEYSKLSTHQIISVGRLESYKNFSAMIHLFKRIILCHSDWILNIYGDGSSKHELQNLIKELDLQKNVFLKGTSLEIADELINSSIFIMTSKLEGFGLVLLEAMACGLPVISYDCPFGPKDIIDNGKDGYLIPMGNEDLFVKKINQLIENKSLRYQMAKNAIIKSNFYYTDNISKMWMDLFYKLLSYGNKKNANC